MAWRFTISINLRLFQRLSHPYGASLGMRKVRAKGVLYQKGKFLRCPRRLLISRHKEALQAKLPEG
jgi:hypothetical protein